MNKKNATALALGLFLSFSAVQPVLASPQQAIQEKLNRIEQQKQDAREKIASLEKQLAEVAAKIERIETESKKTQAEINQLKEQIIKTQKRIEKREELLKERVRIMYQNGGTVNYIEVLFGSESFGDFISRVFALNLILEQDHRLLQEHQEDKRKLEQAKKEIAKKLEKLQAQYDKVARLKADLQKKRQEALALLDKLQGQEAGLRERLAAIVQRYESQPLVTVAQEPKTESAAAQVSALTQSTAPQSNVVASGSIQKMIRLSKKWIGNSVYMMGGGRTAAQIANGIFDCSGFVHWAFAQIGVNVGWSTSILQYQGVPVSPSELRPGDLVFFNTYKHNGHVGIYIGNGKFIGSQSSTGVAIVDMSNPYWSARFDGYARRIIHE